MKSLFQNTFDITRLRHRPVKYYPSEKLGSIKNFPEWIDNEPFSKADSFRKQKEYRFLYRLPDKNHIESIIFYAEAKTYIDEIIVFENNPHIDNFLISNPEIARQYYPKRQ